MRLRITVEPQLGASYKQLSDLAQAAEAAGYDGFFRSDHYMMNHGQGPELPGPSDAWISLAGLALETSTIRLGTLVTPVTFRHPGPLAVTVAQVDAMSSGRIELGVGSGWFQREHEAMGIPFPGDRERSERLSEMLEILTTWWATPPGATFTHRGAHFSLVDCPALPQPHQSKVPIIIGGWGSTRTPRIAAAFAAEYNLAFGTPEACAEQFARVDAACVELGRDPMSLRRSVVLTICCGETTDVAERRAANAHWEPERMRQLPGRVIGTPADVLNRLAEYHAVGVDTIYIQVIDMGDIDHVAFMADVLKPTVISW